MPLDLYATHFFSDHSKSKKATVYGTRILMAIALWCTAFWGQGQSITAFSINNTPPFCAGSTITLTFNVRNGNGANGAFTTSTVYTVYRTDANGNNSVAIQNFSTPSQTYQSGNNATTSGITYNLTLPTNLATGLLYRFSIGATSPSAGTVQTAVNYTINARPNGTLSTNGPFCLSGNPALTFTASAGAGPFSISYTENGTARTATNVSTGVSFTPFTSPINASTAYSITSVTDNNGCTNTTLTGPNASIAVNANPTANAGAALAAVCAGQPTGGLGGSFGGSATAAVWNDGGAGGSFTNNSGSTPGTTTYTPATTASGTIILTLATSGGGCGTASASKNLTVNALPTVNAGSSLSAICQGQSTVALGGSFGGIATGAVWSDGGAGGSFSNNGGTTPGTAVYTPGPAFTGSVSLTLTSTGGNCTAAFVSKSLTVNALPQGSLSTSTSSFCGSGAGMLVFTATAGAAPYTVVYNDGVADRTVNNVSSGVAFAVFTTPVTSNTTYTLVSVTSATGCTRSSGFTNSSAAITIQPVPTISLSAAANTICFSSSASASSLSYSSTTGSPTTYSISWNATPANSLQPVNAAALAASPISIAVAAGTAAGTYTGNFTVTTAAGCNSATQPFTLTVQATSVGGTTTGAQSICSGLQPIAGITLSGQTGAVIRWERSTASDFSSAVTTINNTTSTLTANEIGILTTTTYYRAVVQNGVCASANSLATAITVLPLPAITPASAASAVCYSAASQTTTLTYVNAQNSPATYSITWSPAPANSLVNVTNAVLPANAITISLPAATAAGTYTGFLTVANAGGCVSAVYPFTVTVQALPTITLSATSASVCFSTAAQNASLAYSSTSEMPTTYSIDWASGLADITDAALQPGSISWNVPASLAAGSYTGVLTLKNANGCVSVGQSITLVVNALPSFTPSASAAAVCFSTSAQSTTLSYAAPSQSPTLYSIVWNASPANSFVPVTNAVLPASPVTIAVPAGTAPGTYTGSISVGNANGCASSAGTNFTLTVNALPTASIAGATAICTNGTAPAITFTGAGGVSPYTFTYTINGGTAQTISTAPAQNSVSITVPTSAAGVYTYAITQVQGANSCLQGVTGTSAAITVHALPQITSQPNSANQTLCIGAGTTLSVVANAGSGTITGYQWYRNTTASNVGGTLISGATSASYSPPTSAIGTNHYYVVVTNSNGCTTTSNVSGAVTVNACFSIIASAAYVGDNCSSPKYYNTQGNAFGSQGFQGSNLGIFTQNSNTLRLYGGQVRSFKETGANVCASGKIWYTVYVQGSRPATPTFTSIDPLGYINNIDANTQTWSNIGASAFLDGRPPGNYTLELYYEINGSHTTTSGCSEIVFDNNNGANYTATFSVVANPAYSRYGEFGTAVYIQTCGNTSFYNNTGSCANLIGSSTFNGSDLGSYVSGTGYLKLMGGEIKTFKDPGANACQPEMWYTIYTQGNRPASPSFSKIDLPFFSSCNVGGGSFFNGGGPCGNGGDQKWQTTGANIDLTSRAAGSYVIEVYYRMPGDDWNASGCSQQKFASNGGINYTASFTIQPIPTISYPATAFCKENTADQAMTIGGGYTFGSVSVSPVIGLNINSSNGSINPAASTPGTYTVTFTPLTPPAVGGCLPSTAQATVTIYPLLVGGSVSSNQTICEGTPAALTSTAAASGGNGVYTYQWQISSDGSTWSDIAAATAATYAPGVLTSTTYYRRQATSGTCGTVSSNTITITVNPRPVMTNGNTASVCSAGTTNINLSSSLAASYAWTIGTITGSITGATAASGTNIAQTLSNPSTTAAGSVQYLVTPTATATGCTGTVQTITVAVNPRPAIFNVSPASATICSNSSTNIALSGSASGVSYQLYNTADNSNINAAVTGTGAAISLPTGALTVNTIIGVRATNAFGCSVNMNGTATISISPLPTLSGAALAASPVCPSSAATIQLTGLLPSTTSSISYTINGVAQTAASVISDAAGNGSFTTRVVTGADNGTTLRITSITRNSPTPICVQTFSQDVTLVVQDVTPPVITCPADRIIYITSGCSAFGVTLTAPTATDNCGGTISISKDYGGVSLTGLTFPSGVTTITWTATDANGNTATCTQLVRVVKGIVLAEYNFESQATASPVGASLAADYTAGGTSSSLTFSPGNASNNLRPNTSIINPGIATGPLAFKINTGTTRSLYSDLKTASGTIYYQFQFSGVSLYRNYSLYFQRNRFNQSSPNSLTVAWSTDGTNYTSAAPISIAGSNNTWYEQLVDLTAITGLNGQANVYIRLGVTDLNGNPELGLDNIQFVAQTDDIVNATVSATAPNCNGQSGGSITVNNINLGIWEYSKDGGATWQSSSTFTNVSAGTYDVIMRDAGNPSCTVAINRSLVVTEPATLAAASGSTANIACYGTASGSATVLASGGTAPYSYSWNTLPVQTTATAVNLTAGNYTATVTDSKGCVVTQTFGINQNPQITATLNTPNATVCAGGSVAVQIDVTGSGSFSGSIGGQAFSGTAPAVVNVILSPATTTTYTISNFTTFGAIGTCASSPVSGSTTITVLSGTPGLWTGAVDTDWFNCANWASGTIPTISTPVVIGTAPRSCSISNAPFQAYAASVTIADNTLSFGGQGVLTVAGNMTISNNTALLTMANGGQINIGGNWSNNRGANGFVCGSGTVAFNGSAVQQISSTAAETFQNITISNTSASDVGVTLNTAVNVGGVLALNNSANGRVKTTAAQLLTISNTNAAAVTGGSTQVYVNGPIARHTASSSTYAFPVGKPSGLYGAYRFARVTPETGSPAVFTAEYFASNGPGLGNRIPLNILKTEYWEIDRTSGSVRAVVQMEYINPNNDGDWHSSPGPSTCSNCNVAIAKRYAEASNTWYFTHYPTYSGYSTSIPETTPWNTSVLLSSKMLSSFSPFTFAFDYNTILNTPAPIFTFTGALADGQHAALSWNTSQPAATRQYTVEHSADGLTFTPLAIVVASAAAQYSYTHRDISAGTHWYRLKLSNTNGQTTYSRVVEITRSAGLAITHIHELRANPVKHDALLPVSSAKGQNLSWRLVDLSGRALLNGKYPLSHGNNLIRLPMPMIANGVYFLDCRTDDGVQRLLKLVKE